MVVDFLKSLIAGASFALYYITNVIQIEMKVIKHLKQETPSYKLKLFFKQMPLITKILLFLIVVTSIVLTLLKCSEGILIYSWLDGRPISQMLLLLVVGMTDYQREQKKGSIYFILSYMIKVFVIVIINEIEYGIYDYIGVSKELFCKTSYPMLFCFVTGFRDMVIRGNQQRYFLIGSFQIKYLFYPIFLGFVIQLFGLRIDLISALLASMLCIAVKLDRFLIWISKKIDGKMLTKRAVSWGMLATGCLEVALSQIDRVSTNHSIDLDDN